MQGYLRVAAFAAALACASLAFATPQSSART
jgi:hypothetical protein